MNLGDLKNVAFKGLIGFAMVVVILLYEINTAYCKDICTFITIIGQVFYLKGNKPPEVPAKIRDGAAEGDGVHTKVNSRAQLRLIDASDIFISPKSEIVIEKYLFDSVNTKATVVSRVYKGLIHVVVNLVDKVNPPEIFIKTNYAMGSIRGTDFYVLIGNNFSDFYVKTGRLRLGAIQIYKRQSNRLERQAEIRAGGGGAGSNLLGDAMALGDNVYVGPQQAVRFVEGMRASEIVKLPLEYFDKLDKLMITGIPDHFQEGKDPKHLLELMATF